MQIILTHKECLAAMQEYIDHHTSYYSDYPLGNPKVTRVTVTAKDQLKLNIAFVKEEKKDG